MPGASEHRGRIVAVGIGLLVHASLCVGATGERVYPQAQWQERSPEQMRMDRASLDRFKQSICGTDAGRSAGCVVKDGYVVYSWGEFTKRHNWASASKPCLSTMLLTAIAEGKVASVDAPISTWWGEALRGKDRGITFRHLADMTSGYACAEEPGKAWAYNDYAIQLYVNTLDKVFGTIDHLVAAGRERFVLPLQFEDGLLFETAKGRIVSSPRDFARMGWLWLNRGRWNERQLLARERFDACLKADVPLNLPITATPNKSPLEDYLHVGSYGGGVNQGDGQGIYGFNWWYNACLTEPRREPPLLAWPSAPPDTFMALGRAGKDGMIIIPSLGLVVAAYNDATPTWGDAIVTEPPDPTSTMNRNLELLVQAVSAQRGAHLTTTRPATLDLREPMSLAAHSIPLRLDAAQGYRPWFMIRGEKSVPHTPTHDTWDFGDMTGRYLETLIHAHSMGITGPDLSLAEERLGHYLLSLMGEDGLVHNPETKQPDHVFSQGSALYGLIAWYESTGDPAARQAIERQVHGLLSLSEKHAGHLTFADVKLAESPGSHLAGYMLPAVVRFYELTRSAEALDLAEGLTRWALDVDPTLGADGAITKPLSWEGHIHSWLDTLAGCMMTARNSSKLDAAKVTGRCRAVYDWVKRRQATDFGWIATYPTGGSSETCAISSAIRLALELTRAGHPEYFDDVERFVRNQAIEAQFRDLAPLARDGGDVCPLLLGSFDSQSMPNSHLGTRGGEDVGTVEGCCLNGGTRAIHLAWNAIITETGGDLRVNLALSRDSPWAEVIGYQPYEGRVDVVLHGYPMRVLVRVPDWVNRKSVSVLVDDKSLTEPAWSGPYVAIAGGCPGQVISVRYPLRRLTEEVVAGKQTFRATWRGDTVISIDPPGERDRLYQRKHMDTDAVPAQDASSSAVARVPDTYFLQDAAVAATGSILARLDPDRDYQPFFRIYPFAEPPYASHEKWDDGDMSGRYVEALILARRMTGLPMDPREHALRRYLARLFDPKDGLAYTQQTDWTPRRVCMFSQSSAMMGLLAWYDESGSQEARALLDAHVKGLMRLAKKGDGYVYFPKYEFDGEDWIDEPKGKDAPGWYAGRILLPLVEYWKRFPTPELKDFIDKLVRYSIDISPCIQRDGEIPRGEGWWSHLHGTQDMVSGIVEYARLTGNVERTLWGKRVYDWIGRTNTARFGWIADCSGSHICESCGIASRFRLGMALYRAGMTDPFSDMDRFLRNQLMENQFADLSFLRPLQPAAPAARGGQKCYRDIDRMLRGTFQCWGTANDLIGHTDIEGCGAGGGVQALHLAWENAIQWKGEELWIHLLVNRRVALHSQAPVGPNPPLALEIWSHLPYAGRVDFVAHRPVKVRVRLPDGYVPASTMLTVRGRQRHVTLMGGYAPLQELDTGEKATLTFELASTETTETAAGKTYQVAWKGSTVLSLEPRGEKMPLYTHRAPFTANKPPTCAPRYP